MERLLDRMIRAARLEPAVFEEVEADTEATDQAVLVVVISSVAAGLGGVLADGFLGLIGAVVVALFGWYLWSFIVYFVGTRILPEPQTHADLGQMLRTVGFAASPGIIRVFGFVPLVGPVVNLVAAVWMLLAMILAVRQALDFRGTGRAVMVCLLGWIVYLIFFFVLGLLGLGGLAFLSI
jgi:hypothetical protein